MTAFLIIYLLISVFALGGYLGAATERDDLLPSDIFPMIVLAVFWPALLIAFIYVWTREKMI